MQINVNLISYALYAHPALASYSYLYISLLCKPFFNI